MPVTMAYYVHVTRNMQGFRTLFPHIPQVSCRLQSCQHVLVDACFMTVTCKRDEWNLHVTSMLPVHNMQVSCRFHACNRQNLFR